VTPRPLALWALVAFTLAGCSGSTETPGSSATTAAPAATTVGTTDTTTAPTGTAATSTPDSSASVPTPGPFEPASVRLDTVAEGLDAPVDLARRPGDDTLYVVQQSGTVVPVRGADVGAPVLDVTDRIAYGGEQGLLGLAFHPTEPLAYVNFTATDGTTTIVEYAVADDGDLLDESARTVLEIAQPFPNHNGGGVVFGPDGMLYIGTGDGGAADDPDRRSLDPGDLLGKLLRIDPVATGAEPYTTPSDNPFVDTDGARGEVWSTGLRNPWRFSFDPLTGDLWIADVGQNLWEEVDLVRAADGGGRGANFGWSAWEGTHRFNDDQSPDGAVPPVFEYAHGDDGCSVSGGAVYRGDAVPTLRGWYVFADFCSGRVWALAGDERVQVGTVPTAAAVLPGPDGELYVLGYSTGSLVRVTPA
jgi:glucose/arabinose dehydrogenase